MMKGAFVSYMFALAAILVPPAKACSCLPFSLIGVWEDAKYGMWVEVTEVDVVREGKEGIGGGETHAFFKVLEEYRGAVSDIPMLIAAHRPACCDCSVSVEKGERLFVFAREAGPLRLSFCSPTIGLRRGKEGDTAAVLRKLSAGEPMETFSILTRSYEDYLYGFVRDLRKDRLQAVGEESPAVVLRVRGYRLGDGNIFPLDLLSTEPYREGMDTEGMVIDD